MDDIIFGSTNAKLVKEFSKFMQSELEMSLMELLKRFGMSEAKEIDTPMATNTNLDKDEKGKEVDEKLYRGMIGSLLYLTASRPDIMFSVCMCARYQSCPKESHLKAVKRILRYLRGTTTYGLWYPNGNDCYL